MFGRRVLGSKGVAINPKAGPSGLHFIFRPWDAPGTDGLNCKPAKNQNGGPGQRFGGGSLFNFFSRWGGARKGGLLVPMGIFYFFFFNKKRAPKKKPG